MSARLAVIALALLLGGCSSTQGLLTNRVTMTTAMDECQVASRWGVFSIGADIDPKDCEAIRQGMLLRILLMNQKRNGS